MVNPPSKKSTCQLRLEARSLAYQQKRQQEPDQSPHQARIQRAAELRINHQRALKASARARVQHAQRVAAETHAKRRDEVKKSRMVVREKVEDARQRRREQLERLQLSCKRRVELVLEKVESLKEVQRYREQHQRRVLDGQLIDAARRRQEQTERMVRRLSERWQTVESIKDRVQRIKFIQRWYRRQVDARKAAVKLQTVTSSMEQLSRSWQQIAQSSFEEAMCIMQHRELARAAQSVLRVLLPTTASGEQSPKNVSPRSKSAPFRVLLMVGMLAAHPQEIMESNLCPRLVFASKAVMRDMACILDCLRVEKTNQARVLKACVSRLDARFAFYFESFALWKDRDAERLANEMLRGYHDIYRTKVHYTAQEVAHEGDGMHELIHQTEKQLVQLRSALIQIIGKEEAMERIQQMEENCRVKESHSDEDVSEGEAELSPEKQSASKTKRTSAFFKSEPETKKEPPVQVESLLSDENLVHELILNPEFRLTNVNGVNESSSMVVQVNKTMRQAFWDHVVEQNDMETLLEHLELLRTKCVEVLKGRMDLVEYIDRACNPHVLRTMMTDPLANATAIKERSMQVLLAILQGEAPARNESTQAFINQLEKMFELMVQQNTATSPTPVRVLVGFLAFALQKVEEIQLDMANVHLGMLATYLQHHGTEYEQKKFMKKMEIGIVHMPMTDKWLAMEFASYWTPLDVEQRERLQQGNALEYSRFLRLSMLALVVNYIDGSAGIWPETFGRDMERIRGFRDVMDRVTIIGSMLVIVQGYLTRRRLTVSREFNSQLSSDLADLLRSPGISGSHLVSHVMEAIKNSQMTHQINVEEDPEFQMLQQLLPGVFQQGNAVFSLFFGRVVSAIQSLIMERGQWTMHASLAPFETELHDMALTLRKLIQHNEVVYATYYNTIVQQSITRLEL